MPAVVAPDSEELRLAELQSTDPEAFMASLFRNYYCLLARAIFPVIGSRKVVEDLLQEVFLEVWQQRHALPSEFTYRAFLLDRARRAALRHRQQRSR